MCVCVCCVCSVADINIRSNAYVSKAWGVKKLTLTNNKTFASMSMLPVHRDGPVQVHFSGGRLDIEVIGKVRVFHTGSFSHNTPVAVAPPP